MIKGAIAHMSSGGLFEVCVDSTNKDADGNDTINVMDITTSVWFGEQLPWTLVIRQTYKMRRRFTGHDVWSTSDCRMPIVFTIIDYVFISS